MRRTKQETLEHIATHRRQEVDKHHCSLRQSRKCNQTTNPVWPWHANSRRRSSYLSSYLYGTFPMMRHKKVIPPHQQWWSKIHTESDGQRFIPWRWQAVLVQSGRWIYSMTFVAKKLLQTRCVLQTSVISKQQSGDVQTNEMFCKGGKCLQEDIRSQEATVDQVRPVTNRQAVCRMMLAVMRSLRKRWKVWWGKTQSMLPHVHERIDTLRRRNFFICVCSQEVFSDKVWTAEKPLLIAIQRSTNTQGHETGDWSERYRGVNSRNSCRSTKANIQ